MQYFIRNNAALQALILIFINKEYGLICFVFGLFVFYRQEMDEKNCHKKMIKYGILRLVTD